MKVDLVELHPPPPREGEVEENSAFGLPTQTREQNAFLFQCDGVKYSKENSIRIQQPCEMLKAYLPYLPMSSCPSPRDPH